MKRIKKILQFIRLGLIVPGIDWKDKDFIQDLKRWKIILNCSMSDFKALAYIMWEFPEFRNLFVYRNRFRKVYRNWVKLWYKPMSTLYIEAKEIGGASCMI